MDLEKEDAKEDVRKDVRILFYVCNRSSRLNT